VSSLIFLFAGWSKPYHVPVHKTSCSALQALARVQPVNNKTGSEARGVRVNQQSKNVSKVSACLPVGFITVSEYQVNY
jgi:hypothetical protein